MAFDSGTAPAAVACGFTAAGGRAAARSVGASGARKRRAPAQAAWSKWMRSTGSTTRVSFAAPVRSASSSFGGSPHFMTPLSATTRPSAFTTYRTEAAALSPQATSSRTPT